MKILVISDVHGTNYWKSAIEKVNNYNHIVQMGDWFDDWTNDWDKVDQIKNLEEALLFQKEYKDKVHILIGNHDIAYLTRDDLSGHQALKEDDIYHFLKEHVEELNIAVEIGGYVFSTQGLQKLG
jgi:predicted phosphodiesterase